MGAVVDGSENICKCTIKSLDMDTNLKKERIFHANIDVFA